MFFCVFVPEVYLVGGNNSHEGNLFAINPLTGIDGPVCDQTWNMESVSCDCKPFGL